MAVELAHFAGADDQDRTAFQIPENLSSQRDRCVTDRHRAFCECRFGSHSFPRAKCRVKQLVQERAGAAHSRREAERVLHLAEHLRLSHHERVEPGCHAEQMRHRVMTGLGVKMLRELIGGNPVKFGEELLDRSPRRAPGCRSRRTAPRGCRSRRWSLRDAWSSQPAPPAHGRHHGPRSRAARAARPARCDD